MFAKKRVVRLGNATELKTPLLLPSFSSKGFPKIQKILKACEEYIADEILVSAYDISHKMLLPEFDFASAIFLDSGGYEASRDADLSEIYEGDHVAKDWSPEKYAELIRNWSILSPTVFVSFDHPKYRTDTKNQIERARKLVLPSGEHARSLLLKPESEDAIRLSFAVPPHRGAVRDRHGREAGCGGRGCADNERCLRRTVKTCGPDAPTLASSRRKQFRRRRWQESPVAGESTK